MLSLQCSAEIMKIWESVVENVLLSRIQKVNFVSLVNLANSICKFNFY